MDFITSIVNNFGWLLWILLILAVVGIIVAMIFDLAPGLFRLILWVGGVIAGIIVLLWVVNWIGNATKAVTPPETQSSTLQQSINNLGDKLGAQIDETKTQLHQEIGQVMTDTRQYVNEQLAGQGSKGDTGTLTQTGTVPMDSSAPHMDKIGTFAEIDGAGSQRIEAGGGGWQHVDFYPARGTKSVSYILPPMEPMVWHGFGSIWQCVGNCTADWMKADAIGYAGGNAMPNNTANHDNGRLDQGHSGLVYIWNNGTWELVANVANLSQSQIDELMSMHKPGMTTPSSTNTNTMANPTPGTSTTGTVPGCPAAASKDYSTATNVTVAGPAIVQPWWSKTQYRALVQPGQTVTFNGMKGKVYSYENNAPCVANLPSEFENSSFPVITITGPTVSEPAK